jgi:hypothetical protein
MHRSRDSCARCTRQRQNSLTLCRCYSATGRAIILAWARMRGSVAAPLRVSTAFEQSCRSVMRRIAKGKWGLQ